MIKVFWTPQNVLRKDKICSHRNLSDPGTSRPVRWLTILEGDPLSHPRSTTRRVSTRLK